MPRMNIHNIDFDECWGLADDLEQADRTERILKPDWDDAESQPSSPFSVMLDDGHGAHPFS